MSDEFKIEIKVLAKELESAMASIQKLSSEIEKLQNRKPPTAVSTAFQKYNDIQKNASILTTKLGRDLDSLTKQYGVASIQVHNFTKAQLEEDRVARTLTVARRQLDKALKDGSITREKYSLEMQRMANMTQLFQNKMNMATPIRQMQSNLSGISNLLTAINPQMGSAISSLSSRFSGMAIPDLKNFKFGENFNAEIAKGIPAVELLNTSLTRLATTTGLVVGGMSAIALTFGGAIATNAIKTGARFEDMEYQMMALINSTTRFKDNATGNFVSFEKNMEISLSNAKEMINQFVQDAPRLAGTNLEELTQTASVTLGKLASAGISDPKQQARLIESMTVAIKTVTKGQQNAGTQIASESRGLLLQEFKANNTLINQLATQMGGKEAFKKAMDQATKEGKLGDFLEEQLKPYLRAANFAAGSLSNLGEIIQDFFTNVNLAIANSGLFEAFKNLTKQALEPFIEMVDPEKFGSIKKEVLDFAKSLGVSLTNLLNAMSPLIPVFTQGFTFLMQFLKVAIDLSAPLISAISSIIKVVSDLFVMFQPAAISATIGYFTALIANQTITSIKLLADVITTKAIPALTKFFTGIFAGTTLATGGLTLVISALIGLGVAFVAFASQVKVNLDDISKNLENTFSDKLSSKLGEDRDRVLNILQDLKNNVAITGEEMNIVWEEGMKGWWQKTKFYFEAMFEDTKGFFKLMKLESLNFFKNLWNDILNGVKSGTGDILAKAGEDIAKKASTNKGIFAPISKRMGQSIQIFGNQIKAGVKEDKQWQGLDKAIRQTEISDTRASIFNKIRGLKTGGDKKKEDLSGVGTPPKDSEKEDKAKAREAEQARQQEYKNRLAELKNQLQDKLNALSKDEFEIKRQINRLEYQTLSNEEKRLEIQRKYKKQGRTLSLEETRLDLLKEFGKIGELDYLMQKKVIEDQKIENKYTEKLEELEISLLDIETERLKVDKEKLEDDKEIAKIQAKIDNQAKLKAEAEAMLKTEKDPSEQIKIKSEILKIEQDTQNLIEEKNRKTVESLDKANLSMTKLANKKDKINKEKLDLVDEKELELMQGEMKFSVDAENASKDMFKSLLEGGKEIGSLLINAFQKGKLTLVEAFELAENIFSKFGNMFNSISKIGGGTNLAQSGTGFLSGIGGFFSNLFGGLGRGGGQSQKIDLQNPIGIPMQNGKPMAGYEGQYASLVQQASGAGGGLLSSLTGGGGGFLSSILGGGAMSANPIGAIFTGVSALAGIGGTIAGMFGASKAKKREKQIQATQMALQGSMVDIQDAMDTLNSRLKGSTEKYEAFAKVIEKRIEKMDLSTSIFNIDKAIRDTNKLIKRTEEEKKKVAKIYDQQIAEMKEELEGFQKVSKRRGGSAGKDTASQGVADIEAKIKEVQEAKKEALKDLSDTIEDYQDTIEDYIKSQKELVKAFEQKYQKAVYTAKYGDVAGGLYDELVAFQEEAWDLIQGGFDTEKTLYLLQQQAFKLKEQIKDDLEDAVNSFAEQILGLNEELLGVVSEGRITGKIQKTQQDKIEDIKARTAKAREEANEDLGNMGTNLSGANEAIKAFTAELQNSVQNIASAVLAGKDSLSDIVVNITDPKIIAQEILNKMKVSNWLTNAQI